MIYIADELWAKLSYLTLVGQNFEGELEWIGSKEQWAKTSWAEDGHPDYRHPNYGV